MRTTLPVVLITAAAASPALASGFDYRVFFEPTIDPADIQAVPVFGYSLFPGDIPDDIIVVGAFGSTFVVPAEDVTASRIPDVWTPILLEDSPTFFDDNISRVGNEVRVDNAIDLDLFVPSFFNPRVIGVADDFAPPMRGEAPDFQSFATDQLPDRYLLGLYIGSLEDGLIAPGGAQAGAFVQGAAFGTIDFSLSVPAGVDEQDILVQLAGRVEAQQDELPTGVRLEGIIDGVLTLSSLDPFDFDVEVSVSGAASQELSTGVLLRSPIPGAAVLPFFGLAGVTLLRRRR
jgi:hypothetical protein